MASGGNTETTIADKKSEFQLGLEALKQRGSALLVVGSVPTELYARASKQMLGAPDESRRRLLVLNSTTSVENRLDPSIERSTECTRTIRYTALARGTAAATPHEPSLISDSCERRVTGEMGQLGAEITTDITEFDRLANGLDPAELRVAFDCLPTLLEEYDKEHVFRFLHVLTTHVRSRKGMIHVWSPGERDDVVNRTLEPLFDAVVELTVDGTEAKQRWHLNTVDVSSGWFVLEP
ncbi:hypothetical protein KU306_11020 [Haloferax larsenii]|uniref:RecA-superfamily ATPase, KaiC/GvpD/RAD55 family n=1 Tax=Haloferax larsenii TaxID=302484 RepID=A0ABY5RAT2_HALLR|nr:hypothetical protein [Haloferax larsenii]UVE49452.1 hypothetical protein KU306_11020 [Haloferax larsenii]